MKNSDARKAAGMRATAATASLFVLLAGFGVGTYFIAFRPADVQSAVTGLELAILAGGVLGLAIVTFLAVVSAARRGSGAGIDRLLARALEVDATDPDAIREFQSVPALRDLVASWIGERAQVRELGDRVEALRGEMDGIADGMRRSAQDLGRIRQQPASPLGVQIVATWNTMVERLKETKAASAAAAPAVEAAPVVAGAEVRTLVARLDELESELVRLRGHVEEPQALEILGTEIEAEPRRVPSPRLEPVLEIEGAARPSRPLAGREPTRTAPHRPASVDDEWGEVEVVEPLPRTRAWHVVPDAGSEPLPFASEPNAQRAPDALPRPPVATPPAGAPGSPRFEDLDFPHFVGKPVRTLHDRVAVTYEGQDAAEESAELPANALLFDDELPPAEAEPPVFDLERFTAPERER
jgi:hypothetical protein